MLSRIQSTLRAVIAARSTRVGPFLVHIDEHSDSPFRNYAVPDDAAAPTAEQVKALVAAFVRQGRMPRLEYVAPAPAVDAALESAGFTLEIRLPVMAIEPGELRSAGRTPDALAVSTATTDAELWDAAAVQNAAYGEPETTQPDLDRLRSTVDRGGAVVLARLDGKPAGAGLFTPPSGGLTEIAAVGVLPEFRRRGIASAVGTALTEGAFAAGLRPFLQTETENEGRLYGRLGYRRIGAVVAMSLPK